jgi:hypothetical protein
MRLVKLKTTVTTERTVTLKVPEDIPTGPMEVIVVFAPPESSPRAGSTLGDLRASEFFGMWRERDDIADSSDFARALREETWKRSEP